MSQHHAGRAPQAQACIAERGTCYQQQRLGRHGGDISAVLSHWGPTPLDSACRRIKPAARPRAWHPPTSEPQTCRACRHELAAAHFALASQNRTGRITQCRACCAEQEARRMAALPKPRVPQTKECLDCQQELPAAAFDLHRGGVDGLHSYCRKCNVERTAARRKERLPSQLPPPASIVCAACRKEKPFSGFYKLQGMTFGVIFTCRECAAARQSERRRAAKLQQTAASASSNSGGSADAAGGGLVTSDE